MILLQTLNPGKQTFGIPYHVDLPWWVAVPFMIILTIVSIIVYIQIRRNNKGLSKNDLELKALKELIGDRLKHNNRADKSNKRNKQ